LNAIPDYSPRQIQEAALRRAGLKGGALKGCADRARSYGAQAALLVPPPGSAVGALVGGLYGCAKDGGLQEVARELRANLSSAGSKIKKAWDWVESLWDDDKPTRKGARKTPPTVNESLAITRAYFEQGREAQAFVSAHRWVTPQVLSALYGPDAAAWDAKKIARLWWSVWERSAAAAPSWRGEYRLVAAIVRVGHYLESAPEGLPISEWPAVAPEDAFLPPSIQAAREELRAANGGQLPPEQSQTVRTAPEAGSLARDLYAAIFGGGA
jgi:hypothetical protein